MTPSLGQALPGLVSTRASSKPTAAGGNSEDTSFGEMVRSAENPAAPENQRATGLHDARWTKRASASLGKGEPARNEPGKAASPNLPAGKTAKADADTDPSEASADTAQTGQGTDTAPLQDQLPLLMALHDMRHFSTSAKADGDHAATDEQPQDAAVDGQPGSQLSPLSSKKHRSASGVDTGSIEAMSRSERATIAEGVSGQNPRQGPGEIGRGSDDPLPQADLAFRVPGDQPVTDASEAKPTPATKRHEATRPAPPSERGKLASSTARMDVIAEQRFPAPAQNPMSRTASAVIDAIASDSPQKSLATPSASPQMASSVAVATHILKIELHPAELGLVTASLRLAGEQLSIELKPETHEAYRRLTADSEAIVKSLRGLGFDVDKVAILQPSIAVPAATRTDASSSLPMSAGRDQPSFQPGNSSGNNAGSGGQQPGRNHTNDVQEFGRAASPGRERGGDDMFI
jgi:chemotaxis protein MotD